MIAYLAPEGFEAELSHELTEVKARYGRLFLLDEGPKFQPAWINTTWFDVERIEITSIGDAAKKLRERGKWWTQEPHVLHRRAQLIQDKLPKFKIDELGFLDGLPTRELSSWMLISENEMIVAPRTESPFPSGQMAFRESKVAPSRAYLKLWELFTVHGVRPKPNEKCLELGASPGGWTWVLDQLGCEVTAVDRSPLAANIKWSPRVKFRSGNAFAIRPDDIGPIDWLFSDLICYPAQIEELIKTWLASGQVKNFVCTIKFQGATDHEATRRIQALPGSHVRHLIHNKHELTWWLLRTSD